MLSFFFIAWGFSVDSRYSTAVTDGGRVRRVPRHSFERKELRGLRSHPRQTDDSVLFNRQCAHFRRRTQLSHGFQYRVRRQKIPREKR